MGESFGPIGKRSKFVKGKLIDNIDRAEVEGIKKSKPPGRGLKVHLGPLHEELTSHIKMHALSDSGYSAELLAHIDPGEKKQLHAKLALIWLAEHEQKRRKDQTLAPLTLEQLLHRAVERQYLEQEEFGPFPRQSLFWKRFMSPLVRNGWIQHDSKTNHVRLDDAAIQASLGRM